MELAEVTTLVSELRATRFYDLEQPRYFGAPTFPAHTPGFHYTLHRRHEPGLERRTSAAGLIVAAEHSGTHIDALCHQALDLELFSGCSVNASVQTPIGFTAHGVETIPPIVARGILLDVASAEGVERLPPGHLVGADELARSAAMLDGDLRPGDIVLIRTGNATVWDDPDEYLRGPGIGIDGARWLAERAPLAVGADNVAFDVVGHVDPELGTTLPSHVVLLVQHGVYIIENLALEKLAADGVRDFVFICLPLKMRGVTGSPVRPLALVPESQ